MNTVRLWGWSATDKNQSRSGGFNENEATQSYPRCVLSLQSCTAAASPAATAGAGQNMSYFQATAWLRSVLASSHTQQHINQCYQLILGVWEHWLKFLNAYLINVHLFKSILWLNTVSPWAKENGAQNTEDFFFFLIGCEDVCRVNVILSENAAASASRARGPRPTLFYLYLQVLSGVNGKMSPLQRW